MDIQEKTISAIRALSIDAIEKAKSGHPGLPLGAAAIGYELFAHHLKHNPHNPNFINRDRFVLSAGHGTMLLYGLLHLFGYDLSIDDIKNFRQLDSKTPGHPERGITPGVDVSTGPLGQGIANAVGMAIAETVLASRFNRVGYDVFDHYTYALCGEGCLMEGIANEAASLAGTLKLNKLIVLYDCNKITIEGSSDLAFDEDIAARHVAQGWAVFKVANGNDINKIGQAIKSAKAQKEKPSLIIINTRIGYGSPKENCSACHGAPLGAENIAITKRNLGWEYAPFEVPDDIYAHCHTLTEKGVKEDNRWNKMMAEYSAKYPELSEELIKAIKGVPSIDFDEVYKGIDINKPIAARKASSIILNALAKNNAFFMGGSADLGPSNLTVLDGMGDYSAADRSGKNIHFGIREHAMGAIINGMALSKCILPFCSTFFSFSDYMKNAVRMSAIMNLKVVYVFTHDSIGVGEDGPTHQPIEHLAGFRAMPNVKVFRPADAIETAAAYENIVNGNGTGILVLSRQDLPKIQSDRAKAQKGGYVVFDTDKPKAILLSSGSEVSICIAAAEQLKAENINVRVVSMPCMSIFDAQSSKYKNEILPDSVRARVAVEAASSLSWGKYVGLDGDYVCIDHFGESGKPDDLFKKFGLTKENIISKVKKLLKA